MHYSRLLVCSVRLCGLAVLSLVERTVCHDLHVVAGAGSF